MTRRLSRVIISGTVAGVLAFSAAPHAAISDHQQQPTFKSSTRTVPVYATVFDEDGRLVTGLEQSDFEIYDDGTKQVVTIFDNRPIPFSAALTLDSSLSMQTDLPFIQDAAIHFVTRLGPEDKSVVGFFNSKIQFSPVLTNDRDSLVSFIRNNVTRGSSTRLWDAVDAAMDHLAEAVGRRVVVVLTDGDDLGASRLSSGGRFERAQREDVMIYTLCIGERRGATFKRLAAETGGAFFELKRSAELNSTFTRVIAELHSQYVLGFSPTTLDGRSHKLEVRLTKPGLTARARKSYVAR